nr:MAG TPA: hypothetical protein [Caudoviricetes sp.]
MPRVEFNLTARDKLFSLQKNSQKGGGGSFRLFLRTRNI